MVNKRLQEKENEKALEASRQKQEEQLSDEDLIPDVTEDKLARLKRLVSDGVDTNPEVARKIIKNWIGE